MKAEPQKEVFGVSPDVEKCAEDVLQYLYEKIDPLFFTPYFVKLVLQQGIDWIASTPMVSPKAEHEIANRYREKFDEKA